MKINNTQFLQGFTLYNKKNKTLKETNELNDMRKKDPQLDRALYQADIAKMYEECSKVEQIAKKVAKGEPITKEEEEFINQVDPELLKKANMAKNQGDNLKVKLKNAKTKEEAQSILSQSTSVVVGLKDSDPVYANILMEAIKKAYDESKDNKENNNYSRKKQYSSMIDFQC